MLTKRAFCFPIKSYFLDSRQEVILPLFPKPWSFKVKSLHLKIGLQTTGVVKIIHEATVTIVFVIPSSLTTPVVGVREHCCTAAQNDTAIIFISSQSFYLYWPCQKCWCLTNTGVLELCYPLMNFACCLPCGYRPLHPAPSLTWNPLSVLQACFTRGVWRPNYSMNLDNFPVGRLRQYKELSVV